MITYHASWVLPISQPPIRDGWVAVDRGRVVAVGRGRRPQGGADPDGAVDRDLGDVVLMPGLVNAHTHLELSYLRSAIAPGSSFVDWIRQVMAARRRYPDPRDPAILQGVADGIDEAYRAGTALVGDISNTLVTFEPLVGSPLAAVVFYELIRFRCPDPVAVVDEATRQLDALAPDTRVRTSLAAHAPYSVAPQLFREIRRALDRNPPMPYSVHLAESEEEVRLIKGADGPWRSLLEELGVWEPSWSAPGVSPVEYLAQQGFLGPHALAVHGVQMTAADLALLASTGTTLVTCPRSNAHTAVGNPSIERFYASGVRVVVGTDSLASAPSLSVFAELAAMRALAPAIPASTLLDSATRQGAMALGFAGDYGTIEPGTRAALVTVSAPAAFAKAADVEEYLVSGIQLDRVGWI